MRDYSKLTDTVTVAVPWEPDELRTTTKADKEIEVFIPPNLLKELREGSERDITMALKAISLDTDFTVREIQVFKMLCGERIEQLKDSMFGEYLKTGKGMVVASPRRHGKSHASGLLEQIKKTEPIEYRVMTGSKGHEEFNKIFKELAKKYLK